jgi:polysaccharide pyruvyl transferase WcaK-like protein
MTKPLHLCLIMHSTRSDNLGVGALTRSEVEILRGVAADLGRKLTLTVIDWKDPRPPYITGDDIRIVPLDTKFLLNPFGYFATVRRADAVVDIGAGDSFADIYGPSRLRRLFAMKFLTHLARRPLVVAPQTIGPFTQSLSSRLARWTLNLSALVATRDPMSTAAVRDLGVTRPVVEASDVAMLLPYDPPAPRPPGPLRVGLNLSGLLMHGGYGGANDYGLSLDYPALMRDLVALFQSRGAEVVLVPHVIVKSGPMVKEDDTRASQKLAAEVPGLTLAPDFATPSEAKSFIAGLDFFMGARMHACIAALSSGVPVLPLAYSRKFAGLFGALGYGHTLDLRALSADDILKATETALDRLPDLAAEARQAGDLGRARLAVYRDALRGLLA